MHFLMQGHQPEEIEFRVAGVAGKLFKKVQGLRKNAGQVSASGSRIRQRQIPAAAVDDCPGVVEGVGAVEQRWRPRVRGVAIEPQSALAVAPYPVLLKPADMAQLP